MKKLIIFISILIILIVIGFNYLKTSPIDRKKSIEESSTEILNSAIMKSDISINKKSNNINKINQSNKKPIDEIKSLFDKANNLLLNSKDKEALALYNLTLEKILSYNDPALDEYFFKISMSKGYLYQVYPNIDKDASIEAYNQIIKKFEKSNDTKHIKYYIDANIQLSYLLPEDEKIELYNELISKFEDSTDVTIQKTIESLLITKSFQLMGKNDEEAMQILDKVIEKYQEENDEIATLPENIQFSILNNIELALITNNESDDYVELAKKYMSNSPDTKPLLDMLEIIKNAQDIDQEEALAKWKEEHGDYRFPDWSFQEVERWAYQIEDKETKERVSKYVNAFVNHKYNIPNTYSNESKNENHTEVYAVPYTQEELEEVYNSNNEIEENIENEDNRDEIYQNDIEEVYSEEVEPVVDEPYEEEIYETTGEYLETYE